MKLYELWGKTDRRQFLKTVGAGANMLAKQTPVGQLANAAMGMAGAFSDVPDEELMQTPERDWITKVPRARVDRIFKNNPTYVGAELSAKLEKVVRYGAEYKQHGPVLKILATAAKANGLDAGKLLTNALEEFGMFDLWRQEYGEWPGGVDEGDVYHHGDGLDQFEEFVQKIRDTAQENGVMLPAGKINNLAAKANRRFEKYQEERHDQEDRSDKNDKNREPAPEPQWAPEPAASSMHQYFESKLRQALAMI